MLRMRGGSVFGIFGDRLHSMCLFHLSTWYRHDCLLELRCWLVLFDIWPLNRDYHVYAGHVLSGFGDDMHQLRGWHLPE